MCSVVMKLAGNKRWRTTCFQAALAVVYHGGVAFALVSTPATRDRGRDSGLSLPLRANVALVGAPDLQHLDILFLILVVQRLRVS